MTSVRPGPNDIYVVQRLESTSLSSLVFLKAWRMMCEANILSSD